MSEIHKIENFADLVSTCGGCIVTILASSKSDEEAAKLIEQHTGLEDVDWLLVVKQTRNKML